MTTLLLAMFGMAMAETEVTWTANEQGYANAEEVAEFSIDDNVVVTLDKGTNSNTPKYYTTGESVRVYGGGTLTVSGPGITEISFTFGSTPSNEITADCGSYNDGTWTGEADEVVFSIGGTSGHVRFASITVTYSDGTQTVSIPKPVFSPEGGSFTEPQTVSISTTYTTVLDIYYTLDGTDPTIDSDKYTDPLEIEETTTVKAIAVDAEGNTSKVASETYTIISNEPITIAEAHAAGAGQTVLIEGTVVAAGVTGAVIYDGTDYIYYYNTANALTENTEVKIYGTLYSYGGAVQFTSAADVTVVAEHPEYGYSHPDPVELTGSDLDAVITNAAAPRQYAKFTGTLAISGNYYNITVDGASTAVGSIIKPFFYESIADLAGQEVDVYGYEMYYTNNRYVYFVATSVVEHQAEAKLVDDPYFSHETGEFDNLIELQIFNDDPDVMIYYTLDGTTPSEENGMLYEGMIEIHETTTVKAIAIDDNGNESNVVTATYTYVGVITIAEAQYVASGTTVSVEGQVVASAANGAVVYDGTDYIYYFNRSNALNVGDYVKMTGTVAVYGGANQLPNTTTITNEYTENVTYPDPVVLNAEGINQAVLDNVAPRQYVTVTGTLNISGAYYNVTVDGTESMVSIVKPFNDISDLNGKDVVITGYEMYTTTNTSGNFVYVVATSIEEKESDVATPYFSHESGEYQSGDLIELQIFDDDPEVYIYYTVDGTDPTEASYYYGEGGPIEITSTTTVKAIAFDDNGNSSNIATVTFTFPEPSIEVSPVNINSNYFVRVESLDQIEDGDAVLIVNEEAGKALSTEQKTNNRGTVDVNISSSNTINLNELTTEAKLVVAQMNGYYYFYDSENQGFLYAASSSANQLKTEAEADANAKAEVQPNEDYSFSIIFQGDNTRNVLQYNSGSDLFACYASASQKPVYLYVEVEKPADVKADPELAFEKKVIYIPTEMTAFPMPTLTTAEGFDGTIGYNYDDETVIEISEDATGAPVIVPVGPGVATLYAVSEMSDNFEAGEASISVHVYEIEDGVFDFIQGNYYSEYEPSTDTNATNSGRWIAGNVIANTFGRNVWYDGANGTTLRLYGANEENEAGRITFFAPDGQYITSITGIGSLLPSTGTVENGTWTGFAEQVSFVRDANNVTLSVVRVTYASELVEEVEVEEAKSFTRTFVPKHNVKLPDMGLKGYKVVNVTRRQAVFQEVETVEAGAGIILEGEDGTDSYEVQAITDEDVTDDFSDNELKVSDGTVVGDEATIFVYGQPSTEDPIGFYLYREGNTLAEGKCYLEIGKEVMEDDIDDPNADAKYIGIVYNGKTTAIEDIVRNATIINKNDVIYNISGQRVNNPTHGIFIVNGKKVLIP